MAVDPPRPRPAPLNALRAFEAAARLGGFTAAATELGVSAGAVAQQVKTLEAWAGAALFDRRTQGVGLTPLGASALADFTAGFDRLGAASHRLRARAAPSEVRIAALPSVAQLWLSARLPGLRAAAAGVVVSVTALERAPNLARAPFDLCVFFEPAPGAVATHALAETVLSPVAAPSIARRLAKVEDLASVPCLRDAAWSDDWAAWGGVAAQGPVFSLYALAVEEAVNGAGALIGRLPLVARLLETGALAAPFARRVTLAEPLTLSLSDAAQGPARAVADLLRAAA